MSQNQYRIIGILKCFRMGSPRFPFLNWLENRSLHYPRNHARLSDTIGPKQIFPCAPLRSPILKLSKPAHLWRFRLKCTECKSNSVRQGRKAETVVELLNANAEALASLSTPEYRKKQILKLACDLLSTKREGTRNGFEVSSFNRASDL